MGLSNEERFSKLFWSINRINQIATELSCADKYGHTAAGINRLKDLADQLWEAFIGAKRNSGFWILGGDAGNPVKGPEGAWSAAIASLCDDHRDDPGLTLAFEERAPFNPFSGFLDTESLMAHGADGKNRKAVLELYSWTEALTYALRRYDDEMAAGLKKLNKLAADLQGTCYSLFVADEVYGRAYVLNRVLEALYGGRHDNPEEPDPVRAWLLKGNLHHDLTRPMVDGSLKECIEWDKFCLTHKMTPENRLVLTFRIAGRRFHYDHKFKNLLKMAKDFKPRPRIKVLEDEFAKCKAAHEERETKDSTRYQENTEQEINYVIHGSFFKPPKEEPGALQVLRILGATKD